MGVQLRCVCEWQDTSDLGGALRLTCVSPTTTSRTLDCEKYVMRAKAYSREANRCTLVRLPGRPPTTHQGLPQRLQLERPISVECSMLQRGVAMCGAGRPDRIGMVQSLVAARLAARWQSRAPVAPRGCAFLCTVPSPSPPSGRPGVATGVGAAPAASSPMRAPEPDHVHLSTTTVWRALAGNSIITVLKFAVWWRSGSSAMLSEALHSLADSGNQALLAIGLKQAHLKADRAHPYGYGRAAYFWALVSALGMFWAGAGASILHGVHSLIHPPASVGIQADAMLVLAGSFAVDGWYGPGTAQSTLGEPLTPPPPSLPLSGCCTARSPTSRPCARPARRSRRSPSP